ncbi:MAG: ABC transporter substrate-binding protein [Clostridium sp.]|nr:ABC transporter substrate-binding protein [Clostridium sp.]
MLNTKSEPCNNKDIRKALAYAFPYEEAVDDILKGNGVQSHGMAPAGLLEASAALKWEK